MEWCHLRGSEWHIKGQCSAPSSSLWRNCLCRARSSYFTCYADALNGMQRESAICLAIPLWGTAGQGGLPFSFTHCTEALSYVRREGAPHPALCHKRKLLGVEQHLIPVPTTHHLAQSAGGWAWECPSKTCILSNYLDHLRVCAGPEFILVCC